MTAEAQAITPSRLATMLLLGSRWAKFWTRFNRTRLATAGLVAILGLVVLALTADFVSPYDPNQQGYAVSLQPPSVQHLFGTDQLGRDLLSRAIYGSRVSLAVGVVAVGLATAFGLGVGLSAGYWGGWIDNILMRFMDAMWSFPSLVLALGITAALGPSMRNVMIAVGLTYTPVFARLVRGQVLSVREHDFVMAARVIGASSGRIMLRHLCPNVIAPIIVQASLNTGSAILAEASLSFLGLGVPPPTPTWGGMLRMGYSYMERAPWLAIFPGIAIFVSVLSFNFVGDGLRSALDPRFRGRGSN